MMIPMTVSAVVSFFLASAASRSLRRRFFSALAEKTGKAAKFDETAGRITLLEGVENQGGAQWYAEKDGKSVRFTAPVSDGDEIVFVFAK